MSPRNRADGESVTFVRCAIATADPATIGAFLVPHAEELLDRGATVTLMAGPGSFPKVTRLGQRARVRVITHLRRNPSPWADFRAVLSAWRILRHDRVQVVHVGTPKAGFIVGLAAVLACVRRRVYTIHGLRYETMGGNGRIVFRAFERLSCAMATDVFAVSASAAELAVRDKVVPRSKIRVLGSGSISGVDTHRFTPSACDRRAARLRWGISDHSPVALFVGRLSADKGIDDFPRIWGRVSEKVPSARLIVVGQIDNSQPPDTVAVRWLERHASVVMVGHVEDPRWAYSGADVLVLPTRREGFGTVVLEAAATGVPTVGSDVTGLRDAVVSGETGVLVPSGHPEALADALLDLFRNPAKRRSLGEEARRRVVADFIQDDVVARYVDLLVGPR